MTSFRHISRLLMAVVSVGFMATLPQLANAQSSYRVAPQINNFTINTDQSLAPGTDITFSLEGTPRGQASVRINNINKTVNLREVSAGVYQGSYTVNRRDRLGKQPGARATLKLRGISTIRSQAFSPSVVSAPQAGFPIIERFSVTPVARIEPGAELKFAATGSPAGRALLTIEGVVQDVAMPEVRPGRYEGAYTIRRNDNFPPSLNISMALQANGQVVRSRLNQALLVDARPPTIKNMAPRNNEVVGGNPVSVSATFDDLGGVGVDPKTVKLLIGGQDQTRNAGITAQYLTWRGQLPAGTYPVELTAADVAGNAVRQNWSFVVAGPQVPATVLPLDITSHANNAQVPAGVIEVRGRTAPDAKVDVQVQVIAALAGVFGINQQILNQSIRSDAAGNFVFSFQPQIPVPNARYEATVTATRGDQTREVRLVLFQQR